jgi:hypothetical protein
MPTERIVLCKQNSSKTTFPKLPTTTAACDQGKDRDHAAAGTSDCDITSFGRGREHVVDGDFGGGSLRYLGCLGSSKLKNEAVNYRGDRIQGRAEQTHFADDKNEAAMPGCRLKRANHQQMDSQKISSSSRPGLCTTWLQNAYTAQGCITNYTTRFSTRCDSQRLLAGPVDRTVRSSGPRLLMPSPSPRSIVAAQIRWLP